MKTSLAPGSKVVTEYLDRAGLTEPLSQLGFDLVGYGCTTCIGNSGPLPEEISKEIAERDLVVASVLSGNRNFEGRIHPEVKMNYLASPPLCVAYALAGRHGPRRLQRAAAGRRLPARHLADAGGGQRGHGAVRTALGTNKTGALHLRAETGQGVLWFTAGKVCAGEAGGQTGPPPAGGAGDLPERLHDVCFELFRFTEGSFEFEADRRPSWPADSGRRRQRAAGRNRAPYGRVAGDHRRHPVDRGPAPARPRTCRPEGPITLDAAQWRVVTGIDGRRRVSALIRVLDGGEFTVCKILRSLVQAGLVEIDARRCRRHAAGGRAGTSRPTPSLRWDRPVTRGGTAGRQPRRAGNGRGRRSDVEPEPEDRRSTGRAGLDRGAVVALLTSARSK